MVESRKQKEASIALRELLCKLGIKSAEVHFMERAMLKMIDNYGRPDTLYMPGTVIENFVKMFGGGKDD